MGRSTDDGGAGQTRRPRGGNRPAGSRQRQRLTLRAKIAAWTSVVVVAGLVTGVLAAYVKYREVWGSIRRVAVTDLGKRPPQYTSAVNLLVFASARTSGLTFHQQVAWHVGRDNGDAVSETLMIVHISPGRHRVTVVNIPRDTVVPIYACAKGRDWPGQQPDPNAVEQIGDTLSYGGPPCLWKTIEQQTGIRLDHFIELGYLGLVKVINDIGGVNVCLPYSVDNSYSGLTLPAGEHHINGVTFLKFWRTRENTGNGSDLQRIQRDDYLLAQALKKLLHAGLLSSPAGLLKVVGDAASSMTTDTGLSQSDLLQIGESLRGLSGTDVAFIEAASSTYPANPNWVIFAQPQDDRLFRAIAHDRNLPRPAAHQGAKIASAAPVLDARPASVKVEVLNGSGVTGIAGQAAAALTGRGFDVVGTGDAMTASGATDFTYTTPVIEYSSAAELPEVRTLRKQLPSATIRRDAGLARATISLIVGSGFTALALQPAAASSGHSRENSSGQPVSGLAGKFGGITGNASCRSDTGAFAGIYSHGG